MRTGNNMGSRREVRWGRGDGLLIMKGWDIAGTVLWKCKWKPGVNFFSASPHLLGPGAHLLLGSPGTVQGGPCCFHTPLLRYGPEWRRTGTRAVTERRGDSKGGSCCGSFMTRPVSCPGAGLYPHSPSTEKTSTLLVAAVGAVDVLGPHAVAYR